jgi:dGTPase
MRNREEIEAREARELSHLALSAGRSRGRRIAEEPDPFRTCFQRDRDRIVHSAAFRRLQHKTQVFAAGEGDYYRTRLTHTLEVSQMARSTCQALGLNPDVAESVALAHDLGHPPFGHAGERSLDELMQEHGGFRHNAQGLRLVDELEETYAGRPGLNLCLETRICLLKSQVPAGFPLAADLPRQTTPYLEGQIVDLCDRTAYVCHDVDDAIRSGLMTWDDFAGLELVEQARTEATRRALDPDARLLHRQTISTLVSLLVRDLIVATDTAIAATPALRGPEDARALGRYLATHSSEQRDALGALLQVLREHFYRHATVLDSMRAAAERLAELFRRTVAMPDTLPARFQRRIASDGLQRTACDYVSGMTDRYVERRLAAR